LRTVPRTPILASASVIITITIIIIPAQGFGYVNNFRKRYFDLFLCYVTLIYFGQGI
jgi:hypothetical protein